MIDLRVHAGLCNRMREMASAMALARAADRPLVVYWLKNKYSNCSFERLFDPIEGVSVVDVETSGVRALFHADSLRYRLKVVREPIDLFLGNEQIEEYRAAGVDLVPLVAKAAHCVIITYYRFFENGATLDGFRPRQDILAEVQKAANAFGAAKPVGVHIRGTDNAVALEKSPVGAFMERMEREVERDPQARFFLAADDPATEQTVKARFSDRVITRPKVFARDKEQGVRDALVELLVLSKCDPILGSHWSSFSETAAELGGGRLELVGE